MIGMINGWTGTEMFVDESRVDEYLAAGHTLAATSTKQAEPVTEEPKKAEPKRSPAKKTTTKKK